MPQTSSASNSIACSKFLIFLNNFAHFFVTALLFISVLGLFLHPIVMPEAGFDFSWIYGLSHAIANHMTLGQEIIVSYGPYSTMHLFNPITHQFDLLVGFYFGICFFVSVLLLIHNSHLIWKLFFWATISVCSYGASDKENLFIFTCDAAFFSYPIIVAIAAFRTNISHIKITFSQRSLNIYFAIIFSGLGFLPLVKSSYFISCAAVAAFCFIIFWHYKKKNLAILSIIIPPISLIFFWKILGQPLDGLWDHFVNIVHFISGYSEGVSSQGRPGAYPNNLAHIPIFAVASLLILYLIVIEKSLPLFSRFFLFLLFSLFLFLAFKEGVVRHDIHISISSSFLVVAASLLPFIFKQNSAPFFQYQLTSALLISISCWILIDCTEPTITEAKAIHRLTNQIDIFRTLNERIFHNDRLVQKYDEAVTQIKQKASFPILSGTSDLYSYQQSYLVASGNNWSPRPLMQSYMAYSKKFEEINAAHLLGTKAPDNIFFEIYAIDARLPSLDDGMSLPILLNNYHITNQRFTSKSAIGEVNDLILLQKKSASNSEAIRETILDAKHQLEERVQMPHSSQILFAQIDIKPTLLGRIMALIYKPNELRIELALSDGNTRNYHIISGSAKAGFIISPLIENTLDFAKLNNRQKFLSGKFVKSFIIYDQFHSKLFWQPTYEVSISKINLTK